MSLGPHAGFIIAAYLGAASVVFGLITWILVDYRTQRLALADLEARGISRRPRDGQPIAPAGSA
jgi:heme exporter protein D